MLRCRLDLLALVLLWSLVTCCVLWVSLHYRPAVAQLTRVRFFTGADEALAHSSIRFGLGRFTTEKEVDFVTDKIVAIVKKLRDMSPLYEMVLEGIDLKSIDWYVLPTLCHIKMLMNGHRAQH